MSRRIGLLVLFIFSGFVVSAKETSGEYVIVKKNLKEILEDSSEANRIGKQFSLQLTVAGIGPSAAPAQAISGAYFLERNKQLLFEIQQSGVLYSRYRYEYVNGVSTEYKPEVKMRRIGAHYKQFVSNSFYFRTGFDYNHVDYKYDLISSSFNSGTIGSFSSDSLIANFTIGNQWQWEQFTLGCDWIGIASPLYTKTSDLTYKGSQDSSIKDDIEADQKYYITDNSAILLRLYLGFTF